MPLTLSDLHCENGHFSPSLITLGLSGTIISEIGLYLSQLHWKKKMWLGVRLKLPPPFLTFFKQVESQGISPWSRLPKNLSVESREHWVKILVKLIIHLVSHVELLWRFRNYPESLRTDLEHFQKVQVQRNVALTIPTSWSCVPRSFFSFGTPFVKSLWVIKVPMIFPRDLKKDKQQWHYSRKHL